MVQQIARFCDLQELELELSPLCGDWAFLDQLSDLTCLSRLNLYVPLAREQAPAILMSSPMAQLKAAILERARLVGVKAQVMVSGLDDAV